jgi:hypothetical protein
MCSCSGIPVDATLTALGYLRYYYYSSSSCSSLVAVIIIIKT